MAEVVMKPEALDIKPTPTDSLHEQTGRRFTATYEGEVVAYVKQNKPISEAPTWEADFRLQLEAPNWPSMLVDESLPRVYTRLQRAMAEVLAARSRAQEQQLALEALKEEFDRQSEEDIQRMIAEGRIGPPL